MKAWRRKRCQLCGCKMKLPRKRGLPRVFRIHARCILDVHRVHMVDISDQIALLEPTCAPLLRLTDWR